jgi:uncharacterized protein with GYD domain
MGTYIVLSRMTTGAFESHTEFKKSVMSTVEEISRECPGVKFKDSYATMGRYDFVDIVETDDPAQLEKAVLIMRSTGKSETQTMAATPFRDFLARH